MKVDETNVESWRVVVVVLMIRGFHTTLFDMNLLDGLTPTSWGQKEGVNSLVILIREVQSPRPRSSNAARLLVRQV